MLLLLATTARVKPLLLKLAQLVIFSLKFVKPGKQKQKGNSYRHTAGNSALWNCLGMGGAIAKMILLSNYSLVVPSAPVANGSLGFTEKTWLT